MRRSMSLKKTEAGYLLIELMAAVAIAGVLAMVTVPSYKGFVRKARMGSAKGLLSTLYQCEKVFKAEYGTYTSRLDAIGYQLNGPTRFDIGFDADHLAPPSIAPPSNGYCLTLCSSPWCPTSRGATCLASAQHGLEGQDLSAVSANKFTAEAHAHFGENDDMAGTADPGSYIVDQDRRIIEISPPN